ncbi:hypothetical protein CVT24_000403 [Panaeolus cyanescens]|uniref:C2H2-type domain-containing protein n=1 Tax=Panaeolus cyanescens TaxID=181874 RepID=A0A409YDN6_9AGAR|nr:hypothetical protein CVT24_000403 [Panaeolus cyanescens]
MASGIQDRVFCRGCSKFFPPRGFTLHQAKTQRPSCRQVYMEDLASLTDEEEDAMDTSSEPDMSSVRGPSLEPQLREMNVEPNDHVVAGDPMQVDLSDDDNSDNEDAVSIRSSLSNIDSDADIARMESELERIWEPTRPGAPNTSATPVPPNDGDVDAEQEGNPQLDAATPPRAKFRVPPGHGITPAVIVKFNDKNPHSRAGEAVFIDKDGDEVYASAVGGDANNPYAPFLSEEDWDVACWAKKCGAGSTAFSELLGIKGVTEKLGLSYKNSDELNKIIDEKLPSRPVFRRHEVVQNGEVVEFYSRDIIDCIKTIWADPDFVDDLILQPEKHYVDDAKKKRMYYDMHTGNWWWSTQKAIEKRTNRTHCTVVPVIISSDKTQLTLFRGQQCYPVYITIGNLPKHIRRKPSRQSQMLLAYLPTTKLEHVTNKASRRRSLSNLFHHCMRHITKPLERAGKNGLLLISGDGKARRCYPILAAYVGDYPEQCLVTLVKNGQCPVCPTPRNEIGDPSQTKRPRSSKRVIRALESARKGPRIFARSCKRQGIKPVQSVFWKSLPYVNIYKSITPDILHQLYQGVFKHLVSWIRELVGDEEIDARCRRLPPNHHIRLFMKGLSHLSRVTGMEHDQISKFLLALVADIQLPNRTSSSRLVQCVRALLDFMELARYPIHTDDTLAELADALDDFHKFKVIFSDFDIREDFNIPKIHFMSHYIELIRRFGAPDNFNTEYTERLHIDLAKDAYAATNKKDEYPQMTRWLDRKERIIQHEKHIRRRLNNTANSPGHIDKPPPSLIPQRRLHMSMYPSTTAVSLDTLSTTYGATAIVTAIARYVIKLQQPTITNRDLTLQAEDFHIPFQKLPVFHRIKFVSNDVYSLTPLKDIVVDSIHIDPPVETNDGRVIPGRFDTALIKLINNTDITTDNLRVAQVRCVFTFPKRALAVWFPSGFPHTHMAYVEWFSAMSPGSMDTNTGLFKVTRLQDNGVRRAAIIPISMIIGSVHLYPKFGPQAPTAWTSSNVLDAATYFYVSEFSDRFTYSIL